MKKSRWFGIKRRFLCVIAICLTFLHSVPTKAAIDSALYPITSPRLSLAIVRNAQSPVTLTVLLSRAYAKKAQRELAYQVLNRLRREQPNNAVVLAAYCMSFDMAQGHYSPIPDSRSFSRAEEAERDRALAKAYKLSPRLWLPYVVEGRALHIAYKEGNSHGFGLLLKAVTLAPNLSITHFFLGEAYTVYGTPFQSFRRAAEEFEKAQRLSPTLSSASRALLDMYCVAIPNKAKALKARKAYLASLPKGFKPSPSTQSLLDYCTKKFGA